MKFLNRLEKTLGRLAIPNVTLYIVLLQSLFYLLHMAADAKNPHRAAEIIQRLLLTRSLVLQEPWRLVSFLVIPPTTNAIFFFFAMYLLYMMGTALESHWGVFRYNVYLVVGWLATVGVTMLFPFGEADNLYLMQSIFLAFAFLYPDFELLLFFFFPVKVKWLALFVWVAYLVQFLEGSWLTRCLILAAISNFVLFFHAEIWAGAKTARRRIAAGAKVVPRSDEAFNRCTLCGVTEISNPKMEFRYCPQCAGTLCYCIDHIHAHEHRNPANALTP